MIVQTPASKLQTRRQTKAQDKLESLNSKNTMQAQKMPVICISIPDTPQVSPTKAALQLVNVQFNLGGQVQKQINPPNPHLQQRYQETTAGQRRKKSADTPPPTVKQPHEYKQLPLHRHISSGMAAATFAINLAPVLRRANTIVNSFPLFDVPSVPNLPPKIISPVKTKKAKKSARKQSLPYVRSPSPSLTPGNYEATSKWNDMVQDDEIERLQKTNLPRIPGQEKNSSASEQQEVKLSNQILPGLANMGNTCFANSVLQCLIHTTALREYCRLGRHSEGCSIKAHVDNTQPLPSLIQKMEAKYSGQKLSQTPQVRQVLDNPHFCSFCILEAHVQGILQKRAEGVKQVLPLSVIMLVSKIGGRGNSFQIGVQSDAEEFLVVLIENLYQASFGYLRKVPQSYERQTFIPKLFFFKMEQQRICCSCEGQTNTLADFVSLDLDLVGKDQVLAGSKSLKKHRGTQMLSFDDSLKSFFRVEPLDLEGQCQFCRSIDNFGKRYRLKSLPRVLIVALKRFNHNGAKFSDSVDVPNSFSFEKNFLNKELQRKEKNGYKNQEPTTSRLIVQNIQPQQDQKFKTHRYELYGMVVHDGYSTQSGHYYSVIKLQNSLKWAKFNDEKVTLVEPSQVASYSQKAYLLFYQKTWIIKNEPPRQSSRKGRAQDSTLQPALRRVKTMIDPGMLSDLVAFDKGGDQTLNQKEVKKQGNDCLNNYNGGLKKDLPCKDVAPAQLGDVSAELSTKLVRLKHNNNNINSSIEGSQYKPSATSRLRSARHTLAK